MRTVLISGCSSGFGAMAAREFALAGDRVVATMRDPAKRPDDLPDGVEVRALDVTDDRSIQSCVSAVLADYGGIDVLVNNAGIHLLGAMEDMDPGEMRRLFETNVFGAINLARAVLPSMRARGRGHVITVSSVGSRIGRVADGAYCASKAAVETAFEAMRHEVARFGVRVAVVCPGAYDTGISRNFNMPKGYENGSPYEDLIIHRMYKVRAACAGGGDPSEVARLIREIADDPAPPFRNLAGDKAFEIDRSMIGLDDAEREAMITRLADIQWWRSGQPRPEGR